MLITPRNPEHGQMAKTCIRLVEALTDSELETCIQRLKLVDEYLEVFEEATGKLRTSVIEVLQKHPSAGRILAKQFIAANFMIYPGAKKYLRMSYTTLPHFALDTKTRMTPAAQLVWDLRLKYKI